jgi:hypothetical protein
MPLPADRCRKLLAALRTGLRLEVACAKVGIRVRDVEAASARFRAEVADAEAAGDAFVEATLYERGLAGDAACLKLAIERRDRARPVEDEPSTLVDLLRSLNAPQRDEMRGMINKALAEMSPIEREQRLLGIKQDLDPLPALEGAQDAEPVARHTPGHCKRLVGAWRGSCGACGA